MITPSMCCTSALSLSKPARVMGMLSAIRATPLVHKKIATCRCRRPRELQRIVSRYFGRVGGTCKAAEAAPGLSVATSLLPLQPRHDHLCRPAGSVVVGEDARRAHE